MDRIRIQIVNDAVVVRHVVASLLGEDPDLRVVGTAANGRIALNQLNQLQPDVVLLDVEMPELDGLQTLLALRQTHPTLPVIMFSRFTTHGAAATVEALASGATDYVALPDNVYEPEVLTRRLRDELIPKIKLFGTAYRRGRKAVAPPPVPAPAKTGSTSGLRAAPRIDVVAIGVSTGGPNALSVLLPRLPADLPVPVVIVQHMPPEFTRLLAERLARLSAVPVREGVAGAALRPGEVWLAPGDQHLEVAGDGRGVALALHQGPAENYCRPSFDVLLRSAVRVYGSGVLAVVMTGMGQDGQRGCELVRAAGGKVFAQDEATSVVWGMPGCVVKAGLADKVLPLDQLGPAVVQRVRWKRT